MKQAPKGRSRFPASAGQSRVRAAVAEWFLLAMLAAALLYTNASFTFIDDEVNILSPAAQPASAFFKSLPDIVRGHEHPPLYDVLIHFWLRVTGGAMEWIRVPAVLFFVAGVFLLSRAAQMLGGTEAGSALLWTALLWPYGFHYARLAAWYSFAFLLISALTASYLKYARLRSAEPPAEPARIRAAWLRLCAIGAALVYTNYYGWAILFFLALEEWLNYRRRPGTAKRLAATALALILAYLPLWPALLSELRSGTHFHQSWRYRAVNFAYNFYVAFVSESAAPWFWRLGAPAALAIVAAMVLVFFGLRGTARRFLVYGILLAGGMAAAGILYPRRLFVFAPWILLAIAAAIGRVRNTAWRTGLAVSLGLIGAAGWYGVYARRYYSAPRFFEPWQAVAEDAAFAARSGATVIGNNSSFFFYLTYDLKVPESAGAWHFEGTLPETIRYRNVWGPEEWQNAGHPVTALVVWVRGMPAGPQDLMMQAAGWLDAHCGARTARHLSRDPSYEAKQRFAPEIGQVPWRVEIREYECGTGQPDVSGPTQPAPGTQ